ncbi:MAG: hypothetical protein ACWGPN_03130, partial [Gammaproteobacteria bacterium]
MRVTWTDIDLRSLTERAFRAKAGHGLIPAIAMLICPPSFAQSDPGPVELTLFGGHGFGGTFETRSGDNIEVDDGSNFGVIFDYEEGPDTQWEVLYLKQSTSVDTLALGSLRPSIDTEIHYLQGGGTYGGTTGGFRPFLSGTAGLTYIDPNAANTRSDTFLSISIGGYKGGYCLAVFP